MSRYSVSKKEECEIADDGLDCYIGSRVKSRRMILGLSQNKLASCLGVSFQQVQKYEKGVNRISASMLHRIANALSVNYSYFFDGFNSGCLKEESLPAYEFSGDRKRETTELLRAYYKISSVAVRRKMLELIRSFAFNEEKNEEHSQQ
ncbi:MAG: helix-turn-helix domain-containing protein [Alphaproteobacteria bacterium]|nr:helix-turn-helix domain-containing protein [Alphaproteobacteria bacterium]